MSTADHLAKLNSAQRAAAEHDVSAETARRGCSPLLIIAGAGSGKTTTLAHRVAHLILNGADPRRILMLTFTRRAAAEMTRRTEAIVHACDKSGRAPARVTWAGTFHAIANRLLRLHASAVGLDPSFTVLDRSDAADLMDVVRDELGLSRKAKRFPRKSTCLAIYSHTVNAQCTVEQTLARAFPWCVDWDEELRKLFGAFTDAKQKQNVLDYDDLLLYWYYMTADSGLARSVGERFDHVLVDEYQDTNALQSSVLTALKPNGCGVTVVGDDAQSIYSFRAATVRNILDFPQQYDPPAHVVTLERNYRSTRPILDACNRVIEIAPERYAKNLSSERKSRAKPSLATVEDEQSQVDYVVEKILGYRESGIELKRQAVLFRASHHSDLLEVELGRRRIPFVKFGGLKFLEAAHVKDALCVLRWAENPRDRVAAFRVVQLLPGIGPAGARRTAEHLERCEYCFTALPSLRVPPAAADSWKDLCELIALLSRADTDWSGQMGMVRRWYEPVMADKYDAAHVRAADLEQLEQIAGEHRSRERFLSDLALDPPNATGDEAGIPHLDEDYLILSTIHSAKGQEWDAVFVLNAADGCIPSDMATSSPSQIEEERRLLYVAMTRARDHLHIVHPLRFYVRTQYKHGDRHVFVPRTRFVPDRILSCFDREARLRDHGAQGSDESGVTETRAPIDVGARVREMWR